MIKVKCFEVSRARLESQNKPIIPIEVVQNAFLEITDLVARVYQLEAELEDLKKLLLGELEKSSQ